MFAHVHEFWPMIEVPLYQCILHRGMRCAAAARFFVAPLVTKFYHCDRPMSLLWWRPIDLWRNLCASLLYFVVCVTFAVSSPDELLVFTADVFTVAVFSTYVDIFTMDVFFLVAVFTLDIFS